MFRRVVRFLLFVGSAAAVAGFLASLEPEPSGMSTLGSIVVGVAWAVALFAFNEEE